MVSTQLRVNGLVFAQVGLRPNDTFRNEFDIVVQDPRLCVFALSEAFVLEIAECHEDFVRWCAVSFLELKRLVVSSIGTVGVKYPREGMPLQSEAAEVAENHGQRSVSSHSHEFRWRMTTVILFARRTLSGKKESDFGWSGAKAAVADIGGMPPTSCRTCSKHGSACIALSFYRHQPRSTSLSTRATAGASACFLYS